MQKELWGCVVVRVGCGLAGGGSWHEAGVDSWLDVAARWYQRQTWAKPD